MAGSGDRTAEERRKMLGEGKAMAPAKPGGVPRFPVGDRNELNSAVHLARTAAERQHVMAQARKLGATAMIPDSWASDGTLKASAVRLAGLRASLAPDTIRADGPLSSDQSPPPDRMPNPVNETQMERRKRLEREADEAMAKAAQTRRYLTGMAASARVQDLRATLAPATVMAAAVGEVGLGPTLGTPGEDGGSRGTTTVAPGSLGRAGKANDGYGPDLSRTGEDGGSRAKPVSGPGRIENTNGPMAGGTSRDGTRTERTRGSGGKPLPTAGRANPIEEENELAERTRAERLGEFLLGGAVYV